MSDPMRTVLVTGCSSGIGRAIALLLAQRGYRVLAGVRRLQQAEQFSDSGLPNLEPVILDVTKEADVAQVVDLLRQTCPQGLFALVNNAGMGLPAAVELSTLDETRQLLEVNTLGPLRMIQSCLPQLRIARGRVINMSSMNGTVVMPMVGVYSASKFALEALSDALRMELQPWQISVSVIRPGQVRTSIFAKARESLDAHTQEIPDQLRNGYGVLYARAGKFNDRGANSLTSPETVARTVLRALEAKHPRPYYVVGLDARGLQLAKSLVPQRIRDRVFSQVMRVLKPVQ